MTKRELTEALKIADEITQLPDPFNQLKRVKKLANALTALARERDKPEIQFEHTEMRVLN